MMQRPTACSVHLLCRLGTSYTDVLHHLDERVVTLAKISHFGGPVIHLDVDVRGVLRVPCRILAGIRIPDALQVGRLCTRL